MTNEIKNQEAGAEATDKLPEPCNQILKKQPKRKKAARQQPVEFAVESYEHPFYGYGVRPCWKP